MKEIRHIVEAYKNIDFNQNQVALATVVRVEGSSYRRTGARMLVLDNGVYLGGISGGCLEGDALRRAQKAISSQKASVVTYDTTRDDHNQIGVGLGCNGIIDVLFTPILPNVANNSIDLLNNRMNSRLPCLLATITSNESQPETLGKILPFENIEQWRNDFPIPDLTEKVLNDAQKCLLNSETQTLFYHTSKGEEVRICLEVLIPSIHLLLLGNNNDIYPMARIAKELGWDITVMTNPLKVEKSLFSLAKVLSPKGEEVPEVDSYTAIVLMSHDYKTDLDNFQKYLYSKAQYIGLLGPRKRAEKMFVALNSAGKDINIEEMERIYAPAGLDIGALSPEEIALSIAAEIRACFAKREGASLRLRQAPIHK
jgi:xanthine dehydrogenase accessory factor